MKLTEIIFPENLPKLDLHGYDRDTARVKIQEFITDNFIMKNEFVVIIHGIGGGIIRQVTHKTLMKNKKVVDYMTFYRNNGMTIVQINIDK